MLIAHLCRSELLIPTTVGNIWNDWSHYTSNVLNYPNAMRSPCAIISTILLYLPPIPAISLVRYEVKYWGIYSWQELPIKFLFLGKSLSSDSYSQEMGNLAHHCQLVEAVSNVKSQLHSILLQVRSGQQGIVCCPRVLGLTSGLSVARVLSVILTRLSALLSALRLILNGHMLVSACFPCP